MARDLFSERCPQILAVSPELAAYHVWLNEQRATAKNRDYLFSDPQPRFEPRKEDVAVALPGLSVQRAAGKTRLRCAQPPVDLELPGISARDAERLLGALDGDRCLLEARWEAKTDEQTFARFLRATFGLVLFAPDAVASLEARVSGVEITRFPGAPYGIERAYWDNMADVRAYFTSSGDVFSSRERFEDRLREMHVLALMGRGLSSYYKPASPVSDRVVAPGALFLDPPRLMTTRAGTLFLDGPRVNVSLLGGHGYHQALYESVDDAEALGGSRQFEVDGVPWGGFVTARSERDEGFGPWFCPPRPILDGHWERLVTLLRTANLSADAGEERDALRALAGFHQAFVRLHPFHCANQSIAMNLVNAILLRVVGAGIPHLVLDHLALRQSEEAYARIFARAVRAFAVGTDDPTHRLTTLMDRKARSFSIIEALGRSRSRSEAESIVAEDPQSARFALVID
jgi:hypothetical protein